MYVGKVTHNFQSTDTIDSLTSGINSKLPQEICHIYLNKSPPPKTGATPEPPTLLSDHQMEGGSLERSLDGLDSPISYL